ncbi:superinfection immunity protein [Streptomyces sp. NBC_01341]|uniref:superinfection immunity protein n=1 Tax=Streptomyces sp. NBC_01341 TaxID=2903831 RepID=UPI002E0E2D31|nr:superinfection immunity protein [Streptomyces sp. NBC_01341]
MLANLTPLELLVFVPVALIILFVPSIIAYRRKVERLWLVVVVSLIGGGTGLLWFVALYMAMTMRTRTADLAPLNTSGPRIVTEG